MANENASLESILMERITSLEQQIVIAEKLATIAKERAAIAKQQFVLANEQIEIIKCRADRVNNIKIKEELDQTLFEKDVISLSAAMAIAAKDFTIKAAEDQLKAQLEAATRARAQIEKYNDTIAILWLLTLILVITVVGYIAYNGWTLFQIALVLVLLCMLCSIHIMYAQLRSDI